jgi:hypothetical protein
LSTAQDDLDQNNKTSNLWQQLDEKNCERWDCFCKHKKTLILAGGNPPEENPPTRR